MSAHGITVAKVTVTVSDAQVEWLNETAKQRSASVSDIIRRLIDETRGAYLTPPDARTSPDHVRG
jgi:hypothetical protein